MLAEAPAAVFLMVYAARVTDEIAPRVTGMGVADVAMMRVEGCAVFLTVSAIKRGEGSAPWAVVVLMRRRGGTCAKAIGLTFLVASA
jgi:hypothetical protein